MKNKKKYFKKTYLVLIVVIVVGFIVAGIADQIPSFDDGWGLIPAWLGVIALIITFVIHFLNRFFYQRKNIFFFLFGFAFLLRIPLSSILNKFIDSTVLGVLLTIISLSFLFIFCVNIKNENRTRMIVEIIILFDLLWFFNDLMVHSGDSQSLSFLNTIVFMFFFPFLFLVTIVVYDKIMKIRIKKVDYIN